MISIIPCRTQLPQKPGQDKVGFGVDYFMRKINFYFLGGLEYCQNDLINLKMSRKSSVTIC
jgi:hypothetical protein